MDESHCTEYPTFQYPQVEFFLQLGWSEMTLAESRSGQRGPAMRLRCKRLVGLMVPAVVVGEPVTPECWVHLYDGRFTIRNVPVIERPEVNALSQFLADCTISQGIPACVAYPTCPGRLNSNTDLGAWGMRVCCP